LPASVLRNQEILGRRRHVFSIRKRRILNHPDDAAISRLHEGGFCNTIKTTEEIDMPKGGKRAGAGPKPKGLNGEIRSRIVALRWTGAEWSKVVTIAKAKGVTPCAFVRATALRETE